MLFSVIIPTYNRKQFLKLAVESVLGQTFEDFELIIVDDGSTDATKPLIKSYKDKRIRYFYQDNKGPAAARNTGIRNARAKYICFLDSDDRFRAEKLEETRRYIDRYPGYKIFHTEELWYRDSQYLNQRKVHAKPEGNIFENALKICCVSLSTACIEKQVFEKIGLFDEEFPVCEDYEFWLRAALAYPVKLIPLHLTIKEGGHPGQQSGKSGLDKFRFLGLYKTIKNNKLSGSNLRQALKNLEEKGTIYIKGARKRAKLKEINEIQAKLREIQATFSIEKVADYAD